MTAEWLNEMIVRLEEKDVRGMEWKSSFSILANH